jgi:hypothetical protein
LQCQCCSNFTTAFSLFSSEDALNGTKGWKSKLLYSL